MDARDWSLLRFGAIVPIVFIVSIVSIVTIVSIGTISPKNRKEQLKRLLLFLLEGSPFAGFLAEKDFKGAAVNDVLVINPSAVDRHSVQQHFLHIDVLGRILVRCDSERLSFADVEGGVIHDGTAYLPLPATVFHLIEAQGRKDIPS